MVGDGWLGGWVIGVAGWVVEWEGGWVGGVDGRACVCLHMYGHIYCHRGLLTCDQSTLKPTILQPNCILR